MNAVDKDGYTALTWAAKEGYGDIAYSVLHREAYVNLPDRVGITTLVSLIQDRNFVININIISKT